MGMKRMRRNNSEEGAAAVEFALVLPLLFMLVFGIIWYGWTFNRWISVTNAAREGARELSVGVAPATAESQAAASSPAAGATTTCAAQPLNTSTNQIGMTCSVAYPPRLFVFSHGGNLTSTAWMRKE
jgi:Flp pilus assembly protein TadG